MFAPNLDWDLCRSFLAVLREGSLAGAARRLGVAHPTIRRHVEEIEAGLGASLFARSPQGLVPTELGESLRDPALAMESAFEQVVRAASGAGDAVAGTVRITASEVMAIEVLPPFLAALMVEHPGLAFELDVSDTVADVLRRDADIAVRMLRPTQSDLIARQAGRVALGLFAHRRWTERAGAGDGDLDALLSGGHLIGYDRERLLIDALTARGIAVDRRDFGFRTDSNLAQLAAMRAGLGVAICQTPIAAREPALCRLVPDLETTLEIWVVTHPNLRGSRRVRTCFDALARDLAGYAASAGK